MRKTVNYNNDLLYYFDDDILMYVKDGFVAGSLTTGLEIMSISIGALKDSLCMAYKEDKLKIIDSYLEDINKIREEIKNE